LILDFVKTLLSSKSPGLPQLVFGIYCINFFLFESKIDILSVSTEQRNTASRDS
jgi:hypothetical protein